ncbi:MAG: hypothetical protein IKX57_00065 [Oscillospiraceae bacterium]|nr:hypothetical protein [Oscillospiraceae bacterium]MBR5721993.1 hypothetical protein [Oscillospiraceae bacterium]
MSDQVLYESKIEFRQPGCTTVPFCLFTAASIVLYVLSLVDGRGEPNPFIQPFYAVLLPVLLLGLNWVIGNLFFLFRALQLLPDRIRIVNLYSGAELDSVMLGEIQSVTAENAHTLWIYTAGDSLRISGLKDAPAFVGALQSHMQQMRASFLQQQAQAYAVQGQAEQIRNVCSAADQLRMTGQITQEQYDVMTGKKAPQQAPVPAAAASADMQNAADFLRRNEMIAQQMRAEQAADENQQEGQNAETGSAV